MAVLVISSQVGFSLVFERKEDLQAVVNNLSGQLEWTKQESVQPPYIYHTADESIPIEKYDEFTDELKVAFKKAKS